MRALDAGRTVSYVTVRTGLTAAREVEAIVTGRGLLDVTHHQLTLTELVAHVEAALQQGDVVVVACSRAQRRVWRLEAPDGDLSHVASVRLVAKAAGTTTMIQEVLHP